MISDASLTVVSPVYNEEAVIADFIRITHETLGRHFARFEIILVDDGSRDRTVSIIKEHLARLPNLKLVRLSRNFGQEIAITAGLAHSTGDYTVVMDADLQDSPDFVPVLYAEMMRGGYDMVYAGRVERQGETWLKKLTSRLFYRTVRRLTGYNVPDDAGDFRIIRRPALEAILRLHEHNRFMKLLFAYVGFSVGRVPYHRPARHAGTTKYNYWKMMGTAIDAIVSFSGRPLRYVALLSLSITVFLFFASAFLVVYRFVGHGLVDGWTSIMVTITFLFCLVFLILAVMAEYVGRTLTETKQRPLFYVAETLESTAMPRLGHPAPVAETRPLEAKPAAILR